MIVQITPYYPPDVSGVGDYAWELHQGFTVHHLESQVLSYHPRSTASLSKFPYVTSLSFKSGPDSIESQLASLGEKDVVILHYVGYGYSKRGVPFHLVTALQRWKNKHPQVKLAIMFHEIYATGPLTSSAFWLSGFQRRIARQLLLLSDQVITNAQVYSDILRNWSKDKPIVCCEVFSNVGEPAPIAKSEPPFAVVFGNARMKKNVYELVDQWKEELWNYGVKDIVDIGRVEGEPIELPPFSLSYRGFMDGAAVSELMSLAKIGLLHYPRECLGKSGIYASYLAHGVITINTHPSVIGTTKVSQQLQVSSEECRLVYQHRNKSSALDVFLKFALQKPQ